MFEQKTNEYFNVYLMIYLNPIYCAIKQHKHTENNYDML